MRKIKFLGKQILIIFVVSVLLAIACIIHGVFFDLNLEQIKRLTIGGLIFTTIVLFPIILVLEWVFDINNKKRFEEIEKRLKKLERKIKK
ncbi:MAG: hypothetical protein P8X70_00655 [Nanoarchaeota archaeon]|jgi:hypothetical protein